MIHIYALVTISKAIVLSGLSRRTGKPCRVVSIHHEEVALEGCLDPRGHGFHAALHNISTVTRRVLDLPTAVDFRIGSPSAVYYSLSTGDSVELIGGWGDAHKYCPRNRRAPRANVGRRLAAGRDIGRSLEHGGEDCADQQAQEIRPGHPGARSPGRKEATAAQHGRAVGLRTHNRLPWPQNLAQRPHS